MAKLNQGDVIEGIFSIALGLYAAYGKIDKAKLNAFRSKIEPAMFTSGRVKLVVAKDIKKQFEKKPPDFFDVLLEVRLKPASVTGAFGKDMSKPVYAKSKEIADIDKKIDQLIKSVDNASWRKKIDEAINKFLKNNVGEKVKFEVIADGIAGESSGGDIKGDIEVKIYAVTTKTGTKLIMKENISFSLKSESVTVANLSPYNGMKDLASALGLKWKNVEKYKVLGETARTPEQKKHKFKMIETMFDELKTMIKANKSTISAKAFDFLEKSIFGSDYADVVDITKGGVKEITKEYFDVLKKNVKLDVQEKGGTIVFIDSKSKAPIFQLRTKLRPPPAANGAGEAKFYLEVGKGVYAK